MEKSGTPLDKRDNPDVAVEKIQLKRELGLPGGISFIVGTIVGSGIFVSPKGVLDATGSVGLSLIVWIGAGIISLMGSLCYSELGTLIQQEGGEYAYIRSAFGNLPAFLYTWVSVILIRPSSLAVISLTCGTYFASLFDICGDPDLPIRLGAITCLVSVLLLNIYSTKLAARVQILTTFAKVAALVVIIIGGIYKMTQGNTKQIESGFEGSTTDGSVIALAFYDALWAYDGWNNLNYVTEELKNPSNDHDSSICYAVLGPHEDVILDVLIRDPVVDILNLPRSNIISICLVIIIYLLTNISYLSAMTKQELLDADAVAVLWGDRVLTVAAIIIPLSVMISTFGACNGVAFAGGRSAFSAARDGNFPEVLSFINVKTLTPLPSMLFTIMVAVILVLLGDISSLIDFFSFTAWLFYGTTFITLLYFRVKRRNDVRPYKVPILIPVLMVFISAYLIIAPIVQNPAIEFLYAAIFLVGGAVFYFPFVHFKLKIPGFDALTMYSQLALELAPSGKLEDGEEPKARL